MEAETEPDTVLFEAAIVPHRSLSKRGLTMLIGAICALSLPAVLRFSLLGAWPVAAFCALAIGLATFLLQLNARRARSSELILLSERALRIVSTDMRGTRKERCLSADWLTVVLEERAGRTPALLLSRRDERTEIAAALGADEKRDLARALADAFHRRRHPRFDR
ncbi:MAG: DUF2244 domain-containing protein [Acetobacteraceae bacterium]|nr:DUF2244 domain-containing protein [Acetobacteraceae bacterium]